MKTTQPNWGKGILISHRHFQLQNAITAWQNECIARMGLCHPWGVMHATFDTDALALERLQAKHLNVRFQEGTLIDTHRADELPPALTLEALSGEVVVVLALPLLRASGRNSLNAGEQAERPVRYRHGWQDVHDLTGDETGPVPVLQHDITLRLAHQDNSEYLVCPVARLHREPQGHWVLDDTFLPPLLTLNASGWLMNSLARLHAQMCARIERLMGMRREHNERMADFAVSDVSLFFLLNALNGAEPLLRNVIHTPQHAPERLWPELARLAGSLVTFSLECDVNSIPEYHHAQPENTFPPLFALLNVLMETSLPSRVIAIELKRDGVMWKGMLHDARLRENADFWLSVRSSLPAHELQSSFPLLCKAGSAADVEQVVNSATRGVAIKAVTHVPAAIPSRLGNQFFVLDLNSDAARSMLEAGNCTFYTPNLLGDVKLELFAVLRT